MLPPCSLLLPAKKKSIARRRRRAGRGELLLQQRRRLRPCDRGEKTPPSSRRLSIPSVFFPLC